MLREKKKGKKRREQERETIRERRMEGVVEEDATNPTVELSVRLRASQRALIPGMVYTGGISSLGTGMYGFTMTPGVSRTKRPCTPASAAGALGFCIGIFPSSISFFTVMPPTNPTTRLTRSYE